MKFYKSLSALLPMMLIGVFAFGQSSLQSIRISGDIDVSVNRTPYSDANCSISGPLVAENDPDGTFIFGTSAAQMLALPFTASSNVLINELCMTGAFFDAGLGNCTPAAIPDFELTVYSDVGGVPGAVLGGPYTYAGINMPTGIGFGGTEMIASTFSFPSVSLTTGTSIWISVISTFSDPNCTYGWIESTTGPNGLAFSLDNGATWGNDPRNVSYFLGECSADGGTLTGGPFDFCVGDGVPDFITAGSITLAGNTGTNSTWVITDDQGVILGLPAMPSVVDFDGTGSGTCLVWHLSHEDDLTGATLGANASDLGGCFSLSNSIAVNRTVCPIDDTSIPTMGEWGLISLTLLLAIFGIVAIKERQLAFE